MSSEREKHAGQRFQEAFAAQMAGEYDRAVELYTESLALHPTAEAYTFLGWTYHFQGKIEEAIAECKRAIEIDPEFGNPYNDIGVYLHKGWINRARDLFQKSLAIEPRYTLARQALESVRRMVN